MKLKHYHLTEEIISCFYKVYNELGYGFLEKVYHNSMHKELQFIGLNVFSNKKINVFYMGDIVGEYYADLIINDCVILELKATEFLGIAHEWQLVNYLKATNIEVGLLLNFGKKPEFKRKVFENNRKKHFKY